MTVIELLRDARALITDPARWTLGTCAKRSDGSHPVDCWSEDAVKWCSIGAIYRIRGRVEGEAMNDPLTKEAAHQLAKDSGLPIWVLNDAHGHEAALAAFDTTIARLETEQLEQIPVAETPERQPVLA